MLTVTLARMLDGEIMQNFCRRYMGGLLWTATYPSSGSHRIHGTADCQFSLVSILAAPRIAARNIGVPGGERQKIPHYNGPDGTGQNRWIGRWACRVKRFPPRWHSFHYAASVLTDGCSDAYGVCMINFPWFSCHYLRFVLLVDRPTICSFVL
jgi:hypothetical protein